jgi:hypothetical protein
MEKRNAKLSLSGFLGRKITEEKMFLKETHFSRRVFYKLGKKTLTSVRSF